VGGARSKKSIFRVFTVSFKFYPKPMVPMESQDYEGVPFASLKSLWPDIWQIQATEGCRKVVTWPSRKLKICTWTHVEKFTDSKNAILFNLRRKMTKLLRENKPFQNSGVMCLAVLNIDARLVFHCCFSLYRWITNKYNVSQKKN